MKPVIIESPYKGDIKENMEYLQRCIRQSIFLKEAPFASHRMYTEALDDNAPEERKLGIQAGFEWMILAKAVIFCIDRGMSEGMHNALDHAVALGKEIIFRRVPVLEIEEES